MGAYMLIAFILGFWCIWSANREVHTVSEAFVFTVLSIIIKALMEWGGIPELDKALLLAWGILFIFTIMVFAMVNKFSHNMSANMVLAVGGSVGWFFLARYLFSAAGMEKMMGLVG